MPMLTVWKCPVCEAMSEPGTTPPTNWITVSTTTSTPEVFDRWQCAATWTEQHNTE